MKQRGNTRIKLNPYIDKASERVTAYFTRQFRQSVYFSPIKMSGYKNIRPMILILID
ncbi:conserved hypothetical protein [Xenorhabdus nematophila F1]|uniref:Uncharacterized protein n=1 Tax=Xenorhabdus nematophila (strain ATCC 19061 / DSM 3370 / CCUG 14189 / LMG 1036 / NCIMB 9965 / AN6) TaxID=406817 RepID=D3VCH2_XENNA|nr:hypothetical protein XNC1_3982 [Xenorhabdus nematophila ATCC 19061]CCW31625.1 conserved hypothetical protein [Xenorhabdus nematophila F1]